MRKLIDKKNLIYFINPVFLQNKPKIEHRRRKRRLFQFHGTRVRCTEQAPLRHKFPSTTFVEEEVLLGTSAGRRRSEVVQAPTRARHSAALRGEEYGRKRHRGRGAKQGKAVGPSSTVRMHRS